MKHLKYNKTEILIQGKATCVEGSAQLKDGCELVNTAKKLYINIDNLLTLANNDEEYTAKGLTVADEADTYDERTGVIVASIKAELSCYQGLAADLRANMKAVKAYEEALNKAILDTDNHIQSMKSQLKTF